MWSFILTTVFPLAVTFLAGALGWWATHWLAAPILAFENTRRQAHEELYFNRNLSKDWKADKIDKGEESFRRMAARIAAILAASNWMVRGYFRLRGWDLAAARSGFQGLSNVTGTSRDERTIMFHETEIALGFRPNERPERIERLRKREDHRED